MESALFISSPMFSWTCMARLSVCCSLPCADSGWQLRSVLKTRCGTLLWQWSGFDRNCPARSGTFITHPMLRITCKGPSWWSLGRGPLHAEFLPFTALLVGPGLGALLGLGMFGCCHLGHFEFCSFNLLFLIFCLPSILCCLWISVLVYLQPFRLFW